MPEESAELLLEEFDRTTDGWNYYNHYNERKLALTDINKMFPHSRAVFGALQSQRFLDVLNRLSGIEDLPVIRWN